METTEPEARMSHEVARWFGILKQRLLLRRLNETPDPATHLLIIRQANDAAFLACLTQYPLLTFPCLFEERAAAATDRARRQERRYWNSLELPAPACAA